MYVDAKTKENVHMTSTSADAKLELIAAAATANRSTPAAAAATSVPISLWSPLRMDAPTVIEDTKICTDTW